METKNIVAAISLSAAVIVLYSLFFLPSGEEIKKSQDSLNKTEISDTPTLEQKEKIITISRDEAIKDTKRIDFKNNNI